MPGGERDGAVRLLPPGSTRRVAMLGAACVGVTAIWTVVLIAVLHRFPLYPRFNPLSDLAEHLRDSGLLWSGKDPYVLRRTLNDTTPPFTVILYTPLRLFHGAVLESIVIVINVLALSVALAAGLARLVHRSLLECLVVSSAVLTPLTLLVLSGPAWSNLWWGQDQMLIMSLVVIDLLVIAPRWRGVLIGVAAGVLLSPVVFVLLLVRVGWSAVARMAGGLLGTIVIGGLVNIHASTIYWFHLLPSGEAVRRVFILGGHGTGTVDTPANYSLEGMLARRPFVHHVPLNLTWLVMVALLGALCALVVWRAQGRRLDLTAMTLLGLASAALSPVGWDHHWIWSGMIPLVVLELWRSSRLVAALWALTIPMVFLRSLALTQIVDLHGGLGTLVESGGPTIAFMVLVLATAAVVLRSSANPGHDAMTPLSFAELGAPRQRTVLLVIGVLATLVWALVLNRVLLGQPLYLYPPRFADLHEHLNDLHVLLGGHNPYVERLRLNDTTPPLTAIAYGSLNVVNGWLRAFAFISVNLLCVSVILTAALRAVTKRSITALFALSAAVLTPITVLVLSQAAYSGLWWGQDQIIVMALVVVDLLVIPPRWRGYLIGLGAGILLTPVFFLLLLLRPQIAAVLRAAIAFGVTGLLAAMVNVHASTTYWFHLLPSGAAVQRVYFTSIGRQGNSSLFAFAARAPFAHHISANVLAYGLGLVVAATGFSAAWWAQSQGLRVTAVALVGLTGATISPVSWDHHWIWAILLPIVAIELWGSHRAVAVASVAVIPLGFLRAYPLTRAIPTHHGIVANLVWSAPSLIMTVLLGAMWVSLWRTRPTASSTSDEGTAATEAAGEPALETEISTA